ncbi:MAG: nucleotide pyrophosphatase, partial [Candidatus Sumerlaeota bacterium]|nr:nucleotide pyrophosphatase [Candidatus Sumerlaeota bacterium]
RAAKNGGGFELIVEKKRYALPLRDYTPWIPVNFRAGLGIKVRGLCRFYLLETEPHLRLYVTPIQIDPDKPALPISHPFPYAMYLAKTLGPYATLGVAEDASALNEGVIDEEAFLKQAWLIHEERERMFFDTLDKVRRGLVVCVFDITDRAQHMFMRYMDAGHPANRGRDVEKHRDVIPDPPLAAESVLEELKGLFRAVEAIGGQYSMMPGKALMLKEAAPSGKDMFRDVDWSRTRAYAVGFGGIYLNVAGREAKGIVKKDEAAAVKREIRERLLALADEEKQERPVEEVYDAAEIYSGPYAGEAPDLIAGFRVGYRVSWASVTGGVSAEVFEDNTRPWSGDHNMNPPRVPGMLFSNRPLATDAPHIMDLGPTVLDWFGVPVPAYCDGKPVLRKERKEESV